MTYDRPIYEINIDENFTLGVNCIGLVDAPAIEIDFIKLQAEEVIKLAQVADKQLLVGPLLIPDKKIFRIAKDGTEYYITFSAETIRKIVDRYFKQGNHINFNLGHHEELPITATVNESWIVEDPKMDKSALYGFELPAGTWMLSTHIEDTNDWNTYIKSGILKGYSIEGNFALDLVEAMSKVNMLAPRKGDTKEEYIPKCIKYAIDNEGKSPEEAVAMCESMWSQNLGEEELRGLKISFDYDGTLSTSVGKDLARRRIRNNDTVYIISARETARGMYATADLLGIPRSRVYATGNNTAKVQKIKDLQINSHYDNNPAVVRQLGRVGVKFSITPEQALELIAEILEKND